MFEMQEIRRIYESMANGGFLTDGGVPKTFFMGETMESFRRNGGRPQTSFESGIGIFLSDSEDVAGQFVFPREYGELVTEYYDEKADDYVPIEPGPVHRFNIRCRNPYVIEGRDAQRFIDDTAYQSSLLRTAFADHDCVLAVDVREGVEERFPCDVAVVRDASNLVPLVKMLGGR